MPKTIPKTIPSTHRPASILALAVSGRAIGAAQADRLGLVRVDLLSLQDRPEPEQALARFRVWLLNLLRESRPELVVLEDLTASRKTAKVLALQGVLDSVLDRWHSVNVKSVKRSIAVQWLLQNSWQPRAVRDNLRDAASLLAKHCPELAFHPAPKSRLRTDWDRTWGQAVVAAALALYAKEHF